MKTIWKFSFDVKDEVLIFMPVNSRILCVQVQESKMSPGQPCLWAEVNTDEPLFSRLFRIYGTGHPVDLHYGTYVDTFQMPPFVWHLYEDKSYIGEPKRTKL